MELSCINCTQRIGCGANQSGNNIACGLFEEISCDNCKWNKFHCERAEGLICNYKLWEPKEAKDMDKLVMTAEQAGRLHLDIFGKNDLGYHCNSFCYNILVIKIYD
jgi:hypothetical protein